MTTVSIIVPTRNRVEDLERCLRAIDQQIYRDFEIVVVDDGSDSDQLEKTRAIVEDIEGDCILVERPALTDTGAGPAASRNLGVAHATGSLIAFCDDDDVWVDALHLQEGVRFLEKHLDVNYFFADQIGITVDGETVRSPWLEEAQSWSMGSGEPVEAMCIVPVDQIIAVDRFPHLNTTIVRKKTFDALGGFDRNLRYSSDLCFAYEIYGTEKRVGYRNVVVAHHYVPNPEQTDNVSTQLRQSEKDLIYITIANKVLERGVDAKLASACRRLNGYACKRLAEGRASSGDLIAALHFAKLASATSPTAKWALFTQYLRLRALLVRLGVR